MSYFPGRKLIKASYLIKHFQKKPKIWAENTLNVIINTGNSKNCIFGTKVCEKSRKEKSQPKHKHRNQEDKLLPSIKEMCVMHGICPGKKAPIVEYMISTVTFLLRTFKKTIHAVTFWTYFHNLTRLINIFFPRAKHDEIVSVHIPDFDA